MKKLNRVAPMFGCLSCFLVFLCACSIVTQTYPGPRLPPEKIAILKGVSHDYFLVAITGHVLKVDGQSVAGDEIHVLPGQHEIVVFLRISAPSVSTTNGIPQTFTFNAKAGHLYKIDGNWNRGDNQIWIFDDESKEVVVGRKI